MSELYDVLIIATLLLVPLGPAAAIYYLLSARRTRNQGHADGTITLPLLGLKMSFEAFGSTATYLVILALATALFLHMQSARRADQLARAQNAWQVEVPVYITGPTGELDAADATYTQIHTSLTPFQIVSNNLLRFWVIKENGRFPQVNLGIHATDGRAIDLNNTNNVEIDDKTSRIRVSTPAVFQLQAPYKPPTTQVASP